MAIVGRIVGYIQFLFTLFFSPKFIVHRVMGLAYLVQFAAALYLYFKDYQFFYNSCLIWSLPLTGFLQSIVATMTFTFLPKKQDDPGYYSDKSVLSYNFIQENIYFSGLLMFQWLYMHDTYRGYIQEIMPVALESSFVFLPYFVYRPFFPKTSFTVARTREKNKSEKNRTFFIVVNWVTKVFYIWAKHYIGYFLNYARFLDRITPSQVEHIYLMLIFSAAATTISMFLHTLKFKRYIGPRTSYIWYMSSYLATFYSWFRILDIFVSAWDLSLITLVGVGLQFGPQFPQMCQQVLLMGLFNMHRLGSLPSTAAEMLFAAAPAGAV